MEILYYIIVFILGGVIVWLIQFARSRADVGVLTERNKLLENSLKEAKVRLDSK